MSNVITLGATRYLNLRKLADGSTVRELHTDRSAAAAEAYGYQGMGYVTTEVCHVVGHLDLAGEGAALVERAVGAAVVPTEAAE